MSKRKSYTKRQIDKSIADKDLSILDELRTRLLSGEGLSISEAEHAAQYVEHFGPGSGMPSVDLEIIPTAQDFLFTKLYTQYWRDLDGHGDVKKVHKTEPRIVNATPEEKSKDVDSLNRFYLQWEVLFPKINHPDPILNNVIAETLPQLNELDQELAAGTLSSSDYKYKRKAAVLRSKLIFIRTKRLFQDYTPAELTFTFQGEHIALEPRSLVHILNGHFAEAARNSSSVKSFHKDETLRLFEDPLELKSILFRLGSDSRITKYATINNIPFKLAGQVYVVHAMKTQKPVAGKGLVSYWRLQSFYPLFDVDRLDAIKINYVEVPIDTSLVGYAFL